MGLGTTRPLAPRAMRATDRTAVLRHQRHDPRTPLVARRGTRGAPAYRRRGRSASTLRAPPTPPRPRRREGPRRRAANRDQRQLGHSNLGITSIYLQGIDNGEIIETVHARHAPMIPVSISLRL